MRNHSKMAESAAITFGPRDRSSLVAAIIVFSPRAIKASGRPSTALVCKVEFLGRKTVAAFIRGRSLASLVAPVFVAALGLLLMTRLPLVPRRSLLFASSSSARNYSRASSR